MTDQALAEFSLPPGSRVERDGRVVSPAGRFLLLVSSHPLSLAFEATLFDLLAEARFPAPPPRRSRDGSLIARLGEGVAAACYPLPPGEEVRAHSVPQLLDVGRLLARLHQLGETHPARVSVPRVPPRELPAELDAEVRDAAAAQFQALPRGAIHGGLRPANVLFLGERCAALLPCGRSGTAELLADLAEAAVGFALSAPRPAMALRALVSGYQSLRRLIPEEQQALPAVLHRAAAQEALRTGDCNPFVAARKLTEAEIRGACGA